MLQTRDRIIQQPAEVTVGVKIAKLNRYLPDSKSEACSLHPELDRHRVTRDGDVEPGKHRHAVGLEPAEGVRQGQSQLPVEQGRDASVDAAALGRRGLSGLRRVMPVRVARSADDVGVAQGGRLKKLRDMIRLVLTVGIQRNQPVIPAPCGKAECGREARSVAAILGVGNHVGAVEGTQECGGVIRRSVVDDQDVADLPPDGVQDGADVGLLVVDRYGDQRLARHGISPLSGIWFIWRDTGAETAGPPESNPGGFFVRYPVRTDLPVVLDVRTSGKVSDMTQRPRIHCFRLALAILGLTCVSCQPVNRLAAENLVESGDRHLARNDLDAAIREFQRASAWDPKLSTPFSRLGAVYRKLGDYDRAIEQFVEAVKRNPFSFQDALDLAHLYFRTQRLAEAAKAYLHAVELRPGNAEARVNLGVCYQELGDYAQAEAAFREAVELQPDAPFALVNLGVACAAQGKYYEAIRAYKDALERDANQPRVLVNLANAYLKQDRLLLARESLEQAVRIDPEYAEALEALGYCHFLRKEYDLALEAYQKALIQDPKRPRCHAGLGSIFMLRYLSDSTNVDGKERAIEHWHRSLELDSNQPRIRHLIAKYQGHGAAKDETGVLSGVLEP